jgi:hypothetical protein
MCEWWIGAIAKCVGHGLLDKLPSNVEVFVFVALIIDHKLGSDP